MTAEKAVAIAKKKFDTIDEYIDAFPKDVQRQLKQVRLTIRKVLPGAEETISYQIPTFKLNGKYIIYFAAWKNHIALYPIHTGVESLKKELAKYKGSKSSVHFPLDKPVPLTLVKKIVRLKAKENVPAVTKKNGIDKGIQTYNKSQSDNDKKICSVLAQEISHSLPEAENKIWHAHPVWFLDGNPIVGYSKLKDGVRLMFWSGASFDESELTTGTGKFKDASISYTSIGQIHKNDLKRWLKKSRTIQWDYKNIVKRRGVLKRLK